LQRAKGSLHGDLFRIQHNTLDSFHQNFPSLSDVMFSSKLNNHHAPTPLLCHGPLLLSWYRHDPKLPHIQTLHHFIMDLLGSLHTRSFFPFPLLNSPTLLPHPALSLKSNPLNSAPTPPPFSPYFIPIFFLTAHLPQEGVALLHPKCHSITDLL
jgi:hypothetical protein